MTMGKITTFLNRMHYLAGTSELNGLRDLRIGGMGFRMDPPLDDKSAYGLFGYLLDVSEWLDPSAPGIMCINAATYLVDEGAGFRLQFRWDWQASIKTNLLYLANALRLRQSIKHMRRKRRRDPELRYLPAVDSSLAERFGRKEAST